MAGTAGRSGGKNRKGKTPAPVGDGVPCSPRELSARADQLFQWLTDKLGANSPDSGWKRVDGALLASLAETMESLEYVADALAVNQCDAEFIRLRNTLTSQVVRLSGLTGLCPSDRARHPKPTPEPDVDDPFAKIMERMRRG